MQLGSRAKERDIDLDSDTPQLLSEERITYIAARRTPQLADYASNRLVVGAGITRDKYFELFPNNASFSWMHGWIILEELPVSRLHGFAAGEFSRLMHNAIPNLESGNESSFSSPNWTMQPDACLQPDTLPDPGPGPNAATPGGGAWPTLVFEIHFRRSLSDLMDRIGLWLGAGTQVQIVIAIKCYARVGGNIPMVAIWCERGAVNPVYCVSFGTRTLRPASVTALANHGANLVGVGTVGGPACNGLGIEAYQLRIPSALIFNGVALPAGAPPFYTIDLFTLQQKIIRKYE